MSVNDVTVNVEKKKIFYGWPLAGVMGFLFFASSGSYMASAQIVNPIMFADPSMQMTGTTLGLGFSVFTFIHGFGAPVVGFIVNKIGAKSAVILGASINLVGSLAMALLVTEPVLYIIFFGVMLSFGVSMVGQVSVQTTIGSWFIRNRGKAMALTMTIGQASGVIMPILIGLVIAFGGWRSGWFLMAGLAVLSILLGVFFVKSKPEDIGLLPDGDVPGNKEVTAEEPEEVRPTRVYKNLTGMSLRETLRKNQFWLICFAGAGEYVAYGLIVSQGVLHFSTKGFDPVVVVGAVSLMGVCIMVGNTCMGLLSDRIEPVRLIGLALVIEALALFSAVFIDSILLVYCFYAMVGFAFGSIATNLPTAIVNFFGRRDLAKRIGVEQLVLGGCSSFVGVIAGAIFDATGGLAIAFVVFGIVVCVSALCSFLVRIPKKA